MSDVIADAGAAPAAPEPSAVPINEAPASQSSPIDSSGPERAPVVEQKPASSPREALDRAFAKVEAKGKEPAKPVEAKPEAKVEPKAEQPRGEGGKFASKEATQPQTAPQVEAKPAQATEQQTKPTSYAEAPKGYSEAAKAEWANTPEAVRGDIHRRQGELEKGINQYREVVEPLKPYLQRAQQSGTTLDKALSQYMGIEDLLRQDLFAGLERIISNTGVKNQDGRPATLRDIAAAIVGQPTDQALAQNDQAMQQMRAENHALKQENATLKQEKQARLERENLTRVTSFAEKHPRFEELSDEIALEVKMIQQFQPDIDHDQLLEMAYRRADRLNPAATSPNPAQEPVIPAQLAAEVQPKGSKSISGAPSQGSNPAAKRPPAKSNREALDRAFASIR